VPKPRRGFKFWAIATTMGVFGLLGLVLVAVGPDTDTRLTGLMCVLFFGVGGLGYAGGRLLTRSGAETVRCERVETSAGSEAAFVFPMPRRKLLANCLGLAGMTGGSALLIVMGAGVVGILCTATFGLFLVLLLAGSRHSLHLALTPTRVMSTSAAGTVELPWEAVADADIYKMPAGRTDVDMLGIAATDRGAAVWTRGRWLGRLNRRLTEYEVSFGADAFAGEAEDVVKAIKHYKRNARRRRRIGSAEEHAQLLRELGETPAPA
jgi:hypothetical protein